MTCAPSAAASRANSSCVSIIDSLSPVHSVWTTAARTTVIVDSLVAVRPALQRR